MKQIRLLVSVVIFFCSINTFSQPNLIFDTDFGGDADDLGALAMLNHFSNKGECNILAVMAWTTEEYAVPAIDAVNTFFGNAAIPIGVRKAGKYYENWNYSKPIVDVFEHDETYESAAEATTLYRQILSESADSSVVIVTVGPLKNIENLLKSERDSISSLPGKELVELKVKEFVMMGGKFPQGENEWNFDGNMLGVTRRVIENITVPIIFSGYELGSEIHTAEMFNDLNKNHPLYIGFMHFSANAPWMKHNYKGRILDNATYDQTAVLYAVRNGVGAYWDKSERGVCIPDDTGGNKWLQDNNANHSYLILKMQNDTLAKKIEAFMLGEF